jgi:hypothetical protein
MKVHATSLLAMFFLLLGMPFSSQAQVIGGSGSGQSVPVAATKADLDAGPVGDNVNMFTGNLSLSYSFGNVATLSGLAFPLELRYLGIVLNVIILRGGTPQTQPKGFSHWQGFLG